MRLVDLDRMIDQHPSPGAIMLLPVDWYGTMEDPAAKGHQLPTDGGGYYYRGVRVWVTFVGESRIISAEEAERERLG